MYFANYFDLKEERKRFFNYFDTIDQDKDGQLSFDELVKAYSFKVGRQVTKVQTKKGEERSREDFHLFWLGC